MPPPARFTSRLVCGLVVALLTLYVLLATSVSRRVGMTYDELGHVTSGYAYWKFDDYRVNAENGILASRTSGAPLLLLPLQFPPLTSEFWKSCNARAIGQEFFYFLGNDYEGMLWRARVGTVLFGVGCLWLIWHWARRLFGVAGGVVALGFAALSPTLLAHGGLATSDLILTCCLLAAVSAWWRFWHIVSWARLFLAGLTAGLAFTAKMSGVLLIPMLAALLIIRLLRPAPLVVALGSRVRWLRGGYAQGCALLGASLVAAMLSLTLVWALYGFRYSATPAGTSSGLEFIKPWSEILAPTGQPAPSSTGVQSTLAAAASSHPLPLRLIAWARDHHLLPEAFLWGAGYTYSSLADRESFLNGRISRDGWTLFYPAAFLMKTTPAELALFALAGVVLTLHGWRRRTSRSRLPRWLYRSAPLIVLFTVYWAAALLTPLQIGHRHLLPVYPVIFVAAGAAVLALKSRPSVTLLALCSLGGWQLCESATARPFYLSYFTPFVGGTNQGWRHLVDSSFDWGQGLPDLAAWLRAKEQRGDPLPVYLTYFGSDSPKARKLPVHRFADFRDDHGTRLYPQIVGGWYVISATYYQKAYLGLAGPWSDELEREYLECTRALQLEPAAAQRLTGDQRAKLIALATRQEVLFFGRLLHFLGDRPPQALIGASLLLFKLSDEDIRFARDAPLSELNVRRSSRERGR